MKISIILIVAVIMVNAYRQNPKSFYEMEDLINLVAELRQAEIIQSNRKTNQNSNNFFSGLAHFFRQFFPGGATSEFQSKKRNSAWFIHPYDFEKLNNDRIPADVFIKLMQDQKLPKLKKI